MTPTNPQQEAQTSEARQKVAEVLRKALVAFGPNGEHWGQGTDHIASSDDLCFNVAAYHVSEDSDLFTHCDAANRMLREAGGFKDGKESMDWNDESGRTFADVKAIFETAISKAEKQP